MVSLNDRKFSDLRHALGPPALSDVPNIAMYKAGFTLSDNNVLPLPHVSFRDNPIYMLRLMQWAKKCGRPIHPLAIRKMIRWEKTAIKLRGQKEMSISSAHDHKNISRIRSFFSEHSFFSTKIFLIFSLSLW